MRTRGKIRKGKERAIAAVKESKSMVREAERLGRRNEAARTALCRTLRNCHRRVITPLFRISRPSRLWIHETFIVHRYNFGFRSDLGARRCLRVSLRCFTPPTDDYSINGSAIAQRRNLPPRPIADRLNAMLAKTAKEILETFRLFESLSIPAKHRMRAITGDILHLTMFHKCKLV
jgi:hypothetical protein